MAALNKNNSAVKRIMQEAKELANDPSTDYSASPLEDDIFEWHCTLRGPQGTEYEGGLYHFRIVLPAEYPFRPPAIMLLTPNGRFELNTKICISFTNYHEELWQPAWGVRTAIIGLQGFFSLKGQAAVGVGSIEYPTSERKRLATLSRTWVCPHCQQTNVALLPEPSISASASKEESVLDAVPVIEAVPCTDSSDVDFTATLKAAESHEESPLSSTATCTESSRHSAAQPQVSPIPPIPSSRPEPDIDHKVPSSQDENAITTETSTITQAPRRSAHIRSRSSNKSQKPPVVLDTAICILLVLLFAIICRRMV